MRATVFAFDDSSSTRKISDYRVIQISWLDPEKYSVVAKLYRRIGDVTGLNMKPCEILQVGFYGMGGHCFLHRDYFENIEFDGKSQVGDRISTFLFYVRTFLVKTNVSLRSIWVHI